jgi:hypothetical protein
VDFCGDYGDPVPITMTWEDYLHKRGLSHISHLTFFDLDTEQVFTRGATLEEMGYQGGTLAVGFRYVMGGRDEYMERSPSEWRLTDCCFCVARDRHPIGSMHIFIQSSAEPPFSVWAEPADTVEVLKERIMDLEAHPSDQQTLTLAGMWLSNHPFDARGEAGRH